MPEVFDMYLKIHVYWGSHSVEYEEHHLLGCLNFYQRRWHHISVDTILYPRGCTSQLSWKCILLDFVTWLHTCHHSSTKFSSLW